MQERMAVGIIVIAELLGTSLWFTANAVADALTRQWGLSVHDLGHLTSAVQLGFIAGTFFIAFSGIADRISASRLFAVSAVVGAVSNAAFAFASTGFTSALVMRFVTGLALAGIYPIGMKLVVSWAPARAGRVLGWLVGMLVLGSGVPHLVRGLGVAPHWQFVVYTASGLSLVAAAMVAWLGNGPHHATARHRRWGEVFSAFRISEFRAAALGYFGHMWELYAFYALVPLLAAQGLRLINPEAAYLAAAAVFLAGAIGCVAGGFASQRIGGARVAIVALAGSATCCLLFPLLSGAHVAVVLLLLLFWGFTVVADSPQFSALAARACPPERVGGALALMNSIGFGITILAIEITTSAWGTANDKVAWILLPGPVLGLFAMRRWWKTA